jgi:hypothetical protein
LTIARIQSLFASQRWSFVRAAAERAVRGVNGTPLIAAEERTREVFGDYVSLRIAKSGTVERARIQRIITVDHHGGILLMPDRLSDLKRRMARIDVQMLKGASYERETGRELGFAVATRRPSSVSIASSRAFTCGSPGSKSLFVVSRWRCAVRLRILLAYLGSRTSDSSVGVRSP